MSNTGAPKKRHSGLGVDEPVAAPSPRGKKSKARAASISPRVVFGVGTLYGAIGITWFMGAGDSLRELAFLILIAVSAASALVDLIVRAEVKTPSLVVSGPAAVFIFVCLFGATFLHPDLFGNIFSPLLGRSAKTIKPP